jgi:hypothetical protein
MLANLSLPRMQQDHEYARENNENNLRLRNSQCEIRWRQEKGALPVTVWSYYACCKVLVGTVRSKVDVLRACKAWKKARAHLT